MKTFLTALTIILIIGCTPEKAPIELPATTTTTQAIVVEKKSGKCIRPDKQLVLWPTKSDTNEKCPDHWMPRASCDQEGKTCVTDKGPGKCINMGSVVCEGYVYTSSGAPAKGVKIDIWSKERCSVENNCNPYYGAVLTDSQGKYTTSFMRLPLASFIRVDGVELIPIDFDTLEVVPAITLK